LQLRPTAIANPASPQLIEGKPDDPKFNSIEFAKEHYNRHAKNAAESLMEFLNGLFPDDKPLCVTYFDEAHELGDALWMLLRLLQVQEASVKIWMYLWERSQAFPIMRLVLKTVSLIPHPLVRAHCTARTVFETEARA
jgi:hypothetical protein